MTFRNDIQILRGFCVLLVLFFHLKLKFFENGFLGVDVFFVISGFLMALLFDKGGKKDFYIRRLKRLLPAYFVVVFLTLIVGSVVVLPIDFNQLLHQVVAAGLFSSNVLYWTQNSYFSKAEFNPLLNLWSLGVEIQFYVLVPFLFSILKRRNFLTISVALVSFLFCIFLTGYSPKTAFFHVPFRIWEFLIGAFVAWNFLLKPHNSYRAEILKYALFLTFIACFFIPFSPDHKSFGFGHPGGVALAVSMATALILATGMPNSFQNSRIGKAFVLVGTYSYSIYLVHFPIIVLFNYKAFGGTQLGYQDATALITLLLMIMACSVVLFHGVERQNKVIFYTKWRPVLAILVFCAVGVGFAALNMRSYSGEQKAVFAAWGDRSEYRCGKLFRILNPTSQVCALTKTSSQDHKTIFLVGNSHADSIKTSFTHVAKRLNIGVFFYVPNEPLIDKAIDEQRVLADAVKVSADAVVFHFSNLYDNPKFVERLMRVQQALAAKGIKSHIIAPVPTYSRHVPQYMYDVSIGADVPKMMQTLQKHRQEKSTFWLSVPSLVAEDVGITDPAAVFCTPECLFSDLKGHPYYFDTSHLTLTGARALEPMFMQMMIDLFPIPDQ